MRILICSCFVFIAATSVMSSVMGVTLTAAIGGAG